MQHEQRCGSFLARVLWRNTKAAGVLFDQPQVGTLHTM